MRVQRIGDAAANVDASHQRVARLGPQRGSSPRQQTSSQVDPYAVGHRLMWTPELAIREIVEESSRRATVSRLDDHHAFEDDTTARSTAKTLHGKQLDIQPYSTPSSRSTATQALDFETTSRDGAPTASVSRLTTPPSRSSIIPQQYGSGTAGGSARMRRHRSPASVVAAGGLAVSPICVDLSQQLTPLPKHVGNDTTTMSGNAGLQHSEHEQSVSRQGLSRDPSRGRGHSTPSMSGHEHVLEFSMEDVDRGSESEVIMLRRRLQAAEKRNKFLSEEVRAAKGILNETSVSVDVREQECVELNDLVDVLQGKHQTASEELRLSRDQTNAALKEVDALKTEIRALRGAHLLTPLSTICNGSEREANLREENKRLASMLAAATVTVAQMRAILDRLDLHAPFSEALIGSAKMRLSSLVVL